MAGAGGISLDEHIFVLHFCAAFFLISNTPYNNKIAPDRPLHARCDPSFLWSPTLVVNLDELSRDAALIHKPLCNLVIRGPLYENLVPLDRRFESN
jgi:hypothetical protein